MAITSGRRSAHGIVSRSIATNRSGRCRTSNAARPIRRRLKKRQRPLEEAADHMQDLLKLAKSSEFSRRHLLAATHSDKMSGENKELADRVCAYVSKQTSR